MVGALSLGWEASTPPYVDTPGHFILLDFLPARDQSFRTKHQFLEQPRGQRYPSSEPPSSGSSQDQQSTTVHGRARDCLGRHTASVTSELHVLRKRAAVDVHVAGKTGGNAATRGLH